MKPEGQNSVISFVISKWLFPGLSFSDRWSRGTKTLGTRLFRSFVVLLHNDVRLLQITDNSKPSSGPSTKLGRSVHSLTGPFDQRTMYKHLHASSLLIISKSMDVHPNPGPTAIHILKEFTRPEQRLLFNKVKRLQLKLTRYEQHKNNYTYYYKNNIIPKVKD